MANLEIFYRDIWMFNDQFDREEKTTENRIIVIIHGGDNFSNLNVPPHYQFAFMM